MGLLDQVIGGVLGGLGGQGASTQRTSAPEGGVAGGMNVNPLVLALLALVASKTLQGGAGGLGSKLRDLVTGGQSTGPAGTGNAGSLGTDKLPQGGGLFGGAPQAGGGDFLDTIGGLLGGGVQTADAGASGGGLAGALGGGTLPGGGLGGLLGGGLGGLLERFQQNGHGNTMNSWIGDGPNQQIAPDQLDAALGSGTVDQLSDQTGMDRGDLLSQLSRALPQVVDGLTPHGRLPEAHEESQWV